MMGVTGIAVTIALVLGARPARVAQTPSPAEPTHVMPAQDRWLADDKYRHFFMSFATTAFAYGAGRSVGDADPARTIAVAAGVTAGFGKEAYDRRAGRPFSLRDLAWDGLGVIAGWMLIRNTR